MKLSGVLATAAVIATLASASAEPAAISLVAGYSETIKLQKRGTTVIVGDPTVADAISAGDQIVLTGKSLGSTNLIVLDERDAEVYRAQISVGHGFTVIKRGVTSLYVCTPGGCRRGDGNKETLSSQPEGSLLSTPVEGGGTLTRPVGGGK